MKRVLQASLLFAALPAFVASAAPPPIVFNMGGDVEYSRPAVAVPMQPTPDSKAPRDWSVRSAKWLQEANAWCRAPAATDPIVSPQSTVVCRDGHLDGSGTLILKHTSFGAIRMTGTFAYGYAEGRARIEFEDGRLFEGELRGSEPNGPATFTQSGDRIGAHGTRVSGIYTNDVLSGKVALDFVDGSRTEAVYQGGTFDGPGVTTFANGTRFEYLLHDHRYVGPATIRYADGSRLDFTFYTGMSYGDAIYRPARGRPVKGSFEPAMPDLQHWTLPEYPPLARRLGEMGTVSISFTIGVDGNVSDIRLHETSGSPRLDNAALEAAARWHYSPVYVEHRPIAVSTILALPFQLVPAALPFAP